MSYRWVSPIMASRSSAMWGSSIGRLALRADSIAKTTLKLPFLLAALSTSCRKHAQLNSSLQMRNVGQWGCRQQSLEAGANHLTLQCCCMCPLHKLCTDVESERNCTARLPRRVYLLPSGAALIAWDRSCQDLVRSGPNFRCAEYMWHSSQASGPQAHHKHACPVLK